MSFRVVIPARYAATRLPGKVLRPLAGRPLLAHVHERACEAGADAVWVAADDDRILEAAAGFGARAARTDASHRSGTDRIAELAAREGWADDEVVVNLQGDEPLMPGVLIEQVASALLARPEADIATACTRIETLTEFTDPNAVKVVRDAAGYGMYFSRAPIPHVRDGDGLPPDGAWRHLGIYAYRVAALRRFSRAAPVSLERCESLEQLRALVLGMRIFVVEAAELPGPGVDTEADLARVAAILEGRGSG